MEKTSLINRLRLQRHKWAQRMLEAGGFTSDKSKPWETLETQAESGDLPAKHDLLVLKQLLTTEPLSNEVEQELVSLAKNGCTDAWFNLGLLFEHRKDFPAAIHCFKQLEHDHQATYHIAQIHEQQHQIIQAIRYYLIAVAEGSKPAQKKLETIISKNTKKLSALQSDLTALLKQQDHINDFVIKLKRTLKEMKAIDSDYNKTLLLFTNLPQLSDLALQHKQFALAREFHAIVKSNLKIVDKRLRTLYK